MYFGIFRCCISVRLCSYIAVSDYVRLHYSTTLRKASSQSPQPAATEPASHPSQQPPSQPRDQPTSTQPQKATQKHTPKLYFCGEKCHPFLSLKIVQKCVTVIKNSLFEDLVYVWKKIRKWMNESTDLRREQKLGLAGGLATCWLGWLAGWLLAWLGLAGWLGGEGRVASRLAGWLAAWILIIGNC